MKRVWRLNLKRDGGVERHILTYVTRRKVVRVSGFGSAVYVVCYRSRILILQAVQQPNPAKITKRAGRGISGADRSSSRSIGAGSQEITRLIRCLKPRIANASSRVLAQTYQAGQPVILIRIHAIVRHKLAKCVLVLLLIRVRCQTSIERVQSLSLSARQIQPLSSQRVVRVLHALLKIELIPWRLL